MPAEHSGDQKLRVIAINMARLMAPTSGVEARLYAASSEMPADSAEEETYMMPNAAPLGEIYEDQLTTRRDQLLHPEWD